MNTIREGQTINKVEHTQGRGSEESETRGEMGKQSQHIRINDKYQANLTSKQDWT